MEFHWRNPQKAFNNYDIQSRCIDLFFQLRADPDGCIVRVTDVSEDGFKCFCTTKFISRNDFLTYVGLKDGQCLPPCSNDLENNEQYCALNDLPTPGTQGKSLLFGGVGGKVESGETKEQALIRECKEELAVALAVGDVFMDVVQEYHDLTVRLTLFNATIAEGELQKLEHNDIQWITPCEIANYKFCPADEEIIKNKGKRGLKRWKMRVKKMEDIVKAIEKISERSIVDYLLIIVPIFLSLIAIFVSVAMAKRQNKIAMFELRYKALTVLKRISNFATVFCITKNSRIVIESFNCCFETSIDAKDRVKSLVNARILLNNMEENVAVISDMLYAADRKLVEKTFAMLAKIVNSVIDGDVEDQDVEDFKALCICLEKITANRLSPKILGSSWCFDYVKIYDIKNAFSLNNDCSETAENYEEK